MQYDGAGNLLEVTASVPAHTAYSGTRYFQYQTDDRLQQEDFGMTTNTFGYDSAGNPTTMRGNSYTFNSRDEITNMGYSYDADGNPTTYNSVSMSYDPENHLVASGSSWTAGYNGMGFQAWNDSGSGKIYTLYDDDDDPIIELDSSGNVSHVNSFSPQGLVSRDSTFYTFDWRGGVSQRLNGSATVLTSLMHDAFGNTAASGASSDPFASFGSQWGYYNDGSGLQRLGYRHYDGDTGRFLTADPSEDGLNLYSYVDSSPSVQVDPEGLFGIIGTPGQHHKRKKKAPHKPLPHVRRMGVDIDKMVAEIDRHPYAKSHEKCATKVRIAFEKGGGDSFGHDVFAGHYGERVLVPDGASAVSSGDLFYGDDIPDQNYGTTKGDILVVPPLPGRHPWGHIAIYDGVQWVSDYRQSFPSPYHKDTASVPYTIYRFPGKKP